MITLFQAEWCPFSSAVRERLTELGLDFVARQVEPWPDDRTQVSEIPTLVTDDGERLEGTDAIFVYLGGLDPWPHEAAHRERWDEHHDARATDAPARILRKSAPL